jgi:hypothetical protein
MSMRAAKAAKVQGGGAHALTPLAAPRTPTAPPLHTSKPRALRPSRPPRDDGEALARREREDDARGSHREAKDHRTQDPDLGSPGRRTTAARGSWSLPHPVTTV